MVQRRLTFLAMAALLLGCEAAPESQTNAERQYQELSHKSAVAGMQLERRYAPLNPAFLRVLVRKLVENPGEGNLGRAFGYIPSPVDLSHNRTLPMQQKVPHTWLPASYDLRTTGKLPPVRDQGDCGACWTFGAYAALESYLLPTVRDYSENHMKNTSGFYFGHCEGGNALMATAYLARYSGPVLEGADPYNEFSSVSPSGLAPDVHIQSALMLPDRKSALDTAAIKNAIMGYGAVDTSICWEDPYYKESSRAYYYTGTAVDVNHAVAIVGWDDNYQASNFLTAPPGNGAFIVRNSWGSAWGISGYFYASYYDPFFKGNTVFSSAETTNNFLHQYSYAPLGWTTSTGYNATTAWGAVVFKAVSNEKIAAVSSYFASNGSAYEVRIYKNPPAGNPAGGILAATKSGTVATAGYHTIPLPEPYASVAAGQSFAVVIKFTTPDYIYPVPIETYIAGYSTSVTGAPGRSFLSSNGVAWEDNTLLVPDEDNAIQAFNIADCNDNNGCTQDMWDGTKCVNQDISWTCTDTNPCTDNYCAPQVGCVVVNNSLPCNDHNGCTQNDFCSAGVCAGLTVQCQPAGGGCTGAACVPSGDSTYTCVAQGVQPNGWPCNADNYGCTEGDHCLSGVCTAGPAVDCSPLSNECTLSECASSGPETYVCLLNSQPLEGIPCNADSSGCTSGDSCHLGVCQPGQNVDCSGATDACNLGKCSSVGVDSFSCVKDPLPKNGHPCDADSDGCTVTDSCLSGSCAPGAVADCSELDALCRSGVCFSTGPETHSCLVDSSAQDGDACDDSNPCTSADFCQSGACLGTAKDCSDGIECTVDSCNPGTGTCAQEPNASSCGEQDECNSFLCSLSEGCIAVPKEDWTACDGSAPHACFGGMCEEVPKGDLCTDSEEISFNETLQASLLGFHRHPNLPNACSLQADLARNRFYRLSLKGGWTYTVRAAPEPGLNLALALYTECDESAECVKAVNNTSAGNAEQIVGIKPALDVVYYLQVSEVVGDSPEGAASEFDVFFKSTPPPTPVPDPEPESEVLTQPEGPDEVLSSDADWDQAGTDTAAPEGDTGTVQPAASSGCSATSTGSEQRTAIVCLLLALACFRMVRRKGHPGPQRRLLIKNST